MDDSTDKKASEHLADRVRRKAEETRSGLSLANLTSEWVDEIVRNRWEDGVPGVALIALGGSGRGEMSPRSDIDLMFFHGNRDGAPVKDACLRTVYALWDDGFDVGYSIRNTRETKEEALADIRTRNALLDTRLVAGKAELEETFRRDVLPTVLRYRRKNYLRALITDREKRRREFGGTPYLLEPNVKESAGGLRDLQTALWLSRVAFQTDGFRGLDRVLERRDVISLYAALDFLWRVRIHLHLAAGRRHDVLDFTLQEQIGRRLGYGPKGSRTADERLMSRYFLRVRSAEEVCKRLIERAVESVIGQRGGPSRLFFRRLPEPFRVSKGYLIMAPGAETGKRPATLMQAFALSARHAAPLSTALVSEIRSRLREFTALRTDPEAGRWFLQILKGPRVTRTLATMHGLGVLGRYIPEFGHLQCLVIRDPFHRYTVDEHSLHVVKALEDLGEATAHRTRHLSDAGVAVEGRIHLLYLAGLLHDTAKGGRSPHLGSHRQTDILPVLERFPLTDDEREFTRFLVRHHELLSRTAQKREAEDPAVAEEVARRVGDLHRLGALYLITYADQSAVRPGFWSDWRSHLVTDLYLRVREELRERRTEAAAPVPDTTDERATLLRNFPERYAVFTDVETLREDAALVSATPAREPGVRTRKVTGRALELVVLTPVRAGIFPSVAGLLAARKLNIVRAQVFTGNDSRELLRFVVSNWEEVAWPGGEDALRRELRSLVATGKGLTPPEQSPVKSSHRTVVTVDNETSPGMTVLEILCADRVGLLYDLASLIEERGGSIESARIDTDGTTAHDILYLNHLPASCTMDVLQGLAAMLFPPGEE